MNRASYAVLLMAAVCSLSIVSGRVGKEKETSETPDAESRGYSGSKIQSLFSSRDSPGPAIWPPADECTDPVLKAFCEEAFTKGYCSHPQFNNGNFRICSKSCSNSCSKDNNNVPSNPANPSAPNTNPQTAPATAHNPAPAPSAFTPNQLPAGQNTNNNGGQPGQSPVVPNANPQPQTPQVPANGNQGATPVAPGNTPIKPQNPSSGPQQPNGQNPSVVPQPVTPNQGSQQNQTDPQRFIDPRPESAALAPCPDRHPKLLCEVARNMGGCKNRKVAEDWCSQTCNSTGNCRQPGNSGFQNNGQDECGDQTHRQACEALLRIGSCEKAEFRPVLIYSCPITCSHRSCTGAAAPPRGRKSKQNYFLSALTGAAGAALAGGIAHMFGGKKQDKQPYPSNYQPNYYPQQYPQPLAGGSQPSMYPNPYDAPQPEVLGTVNVPVLQQSIVQKPALLVGFQSRCQKHANAGLCYSPDVCSQCRTECATKNYYC